MTMWQSGLRPRMNLSPSSWMLAPSLAPLITCSEAITHLWGYADSSRLSHGQGKSTLPYFRLNCTGAGAPIQASEEHFRASREKRAVLFRSFPSWDRLLACPHRLAACPTRYASFLPLALSLDPTQQVADGLEHLFDHLRRRHRQPNVGLAGILIASQAWQARRGRSRACQRAELPSREPEWPDGCPAAPRRQTAATEPCRFG